MCPTGSQESTEYGKYDSINDIKLVQMYLYTSQLGLGGRSVNGVLDWGQGQAAYPLGTS